MSKSKYNTSCPSGFPEFGPAEERIQTQWLSIIQETFSTNGFLPVNTPLVEREENLLGKGGNPKEMYVLKRLLDQDDNQSHTGNALRFDLTVPLALYVARHFSELTFPFKRYAIGPVFRGERPQKGRFRQFTQCDIDIIGSEKLSFLNDAQVVSVIIQLFEKLNIGKFVVRLNNRKILTGLFADLKIPEDLIKPTLSAVDDLEKIGEEGVEDAMKLLGLDKAQIHSILSFTRLKGDSETMLQKLEKFHSHETFTQGVEEMRTVLQGLSDMEVNPTRYQLDFSIARGLDYYTGTVYETKLVGHSKLGSICSGGRYDDLAEVFTGRKLPGVGISIGLTRLLSQLFAEGIIKPDRASPSEILIIATSKNEMSTSLKLGQELRNQGVHAENYLEDKKLSKQFDYADKLGIPICLILGENEVKNKTLTIKNMKSGEQKEIPQSEIFKALNA